MKYLDPVTYSKKIMNLMENDMPKVDEVVPVKGEKTMKQRIQELTEEEKTKLKQYMEAIKEIKSEIFELLHKDKVQEGGDMTGRILSVNEEPEDSFDPGTIVQVRIPVVGENRNGPQEFDAEEKFIVLGTDGGEVICRVFGGGEDEMWTFDKLEFEDSVQDTGERYDFDQDNYDNYDDEDDDDDEY